MVILIKNQNGNSQIRNSNQKACLNFSPKKGLSSEGMATVFELKILWNPSWYSSKWFSNFLAIISSGQQLLLKLSL